MQDIQKNKGKHPENIIRIFNNNSRYLDDILTVNNPEFLKYAAKIYPKELQLNKANTNSKCCAFLDLTLKIQNGKVYTKIYDKRDDFDFPITNFPFLDGDVPLSPSYGVYISQLVRFARVCSNVKDFNERNLTITSKLLQQGYRFHKILITFRKFFKRYKELIEKYGVTCKKLVIDGISHPRFYCNVINKPTHLTSNIVKLGRTLKIFNSKGYRKDVLTTSVKMALRSDDLYILNRYWPLTNTADTS